MPDVSSSETWQGWPLCVFGPRDRVGLLSDRSVKQALRKSWSRLSSFPLWHLCAASQRVLKGGIEQPQVNPGSDSCFHEHMTSEVGGTARRYLLDSQAGCVVVFRLFNTGLWGCRMQHVRLSWVLKQSSPLRGIVLAFLHNGFILLGMSWSAQAVCLAASQACR